MDLGTVRKKLMLREYITKEAFVADLNLIWANCLKYNADPTHPLRRHAISMRNETERLSRAIPELDVMPIFDGVDVKPTQGIASGPGVPEERNPPQDPPPPPTAPLKEQTPKLFVARTISEDLTCSEASTRKHLLCALQERPWTLKIDSEGLRLGSKRMFADESGVGNGPLTLRKMFAERCSLKRAEAGPQNQARGCSRKRADILLGRGGRCGCLVEHETGITFHVPYFFGIGKPG